MLAQSEGDSSLDFLRKLDAICREFETQWKTGPPPQLESFLSIIGVKGRNQLLGELVAIEHDYRRNAQGGVLSNDELCALHPELMPELALHLDSLTKGDSDQTVAHCRFGQTTEDNLQIDETPHHQTAKGSSRGLHIRCPHCSNPVELLGDTSFDSIICQTCGSAFSLINENEATQMAPTLRTIGRFEIVGRLGVGGFGTVWKARDPELERAVAIKIPRKGQLDREEIENFLKEARTAAHLHHPHIVPVYEVGRDADTVFIVSELIRGVSLSDWLSGVTPNFRQIVEILIPVAEALNHAHQNGVIHRDLKPSNILIDENAEPKVMDFGLAKRDGLEIAMTLDGQIIGTPAYMSPEQAAGKSNWTDRRMDIYSFGVVLFRVLTGELPYRGNAQMQIHQRLTVDAPDPRTLNRYVPRDLATICLKCLERDPNSRYPNALQVAEELGRFLNGEPILARPISRIERFLRWGKRKPWLATAAGLMAILAVGGPTTAIIIEGLRQRQADLLTERTNLIERMGDERSTLIGEKSVLQEELGVWKGQANPWKIWPPKPADSPQKSLLQEILASRETLAEKSKPASTPIESAYLNLALAAMYDELSEPRRAFEHYSKAQLALQQLCAEEPLSPYCDLAYANCLKQLASLTVDTDRQQAMAYLAKAKNVLSKANSQEALTQTELLEVQIDSAIVPGFDKATESLMAAEQVKQDFRSTVPTSPRELYKLVCLLTNRMPFLILSDDVPSKASEKAEATKPAAAGKSQ